MTCQHVHSLRYIILPQVNGLEAVAGVQGRIGLLHAFQQVIRREGFKALWKGNGVTIVHRLPYSAVNFWAYEQATQLWLQVWRSYPLPSCSALHDVFQAAKDGAVVQHHTLCTYSLHAGNMKSRDEFA